MKKLIIAAVFAFASVALTATAEDLGPSYDRDMTKYGQVTTNDDLTISKPFGKLKSKQDVTIGIDTSRIIKRGTTVFEEDEDDYTGNPGMFGFGVSYKINGGSVSGQFSHPVGSSWYFSDQGFEYLSNLMTGRSQKIGDLTWNCAYTALSPNYNMTTVPFVFGTNVTGFASASLKPRVLELPDWETSADDMKTKQNGDQVFADREWVFNLVTNLVRQINAGRTVTIDADGKITIQ